jgi:hypothetical protein
MSNEAYKRFNKPNTSGTRANGGTARTNQGYYHPLNKEKYVGDPDLIIYRSSWEYAFAKWCDVSPSVTRWSSEPIKIPYYDRVSKLEECAKMKLDPNNPANWEVKNYNTDFWIELERNGNKEKIFVEIKPSHKLVKPIPVPPTATIKEQKAFINAAKEYMINEAKHAAMKAWAERNGSKFYVFTEKTLERILGRVWHENK